MKTQLLFVALCFFALGLFSATLASQNSLATGFFTAAPNAKQCVNGSIQSIVSPGSAETLVAALNGAQKTVDVQMYVFTAGELKQALADAVKRGATVRVILEPRVDSNLATAQELRAAGVQVRWASTEFANTHSKLAIIDGEHVLVGSINWSKHALYQNREAEVLVSDARIAQEFEAVFQEDWLKAN